MDQTNNHKKFFLLFTKRGSLVLIMFYIFCENQALS